jgi:type II secretion system protein N
MSRRTLGRAIALTFASGALFLGFIYLFFPTGHIDTAITQILEPQGLKLSPQAKKTILPGLAWENLQLSSERGVLVSCERLMVKPLLMPLLVGRAAFSVTAAIGKGQMLFEYALNGSDAVNFAADGVNISDIPFFKNVLSAKAAGVIWSQGKLRHGAKGLSGEFKLEISQLEFSGVKLGGFPLPDTSGLKTQGMVKVSDGRTRLESLTLEGDGIYMRLSGDLPSGVNAGTAPLNMSLEIMPKAEFMEKQKLVFLLLAKFMTSPGVYKLPIRGTLLNPEIL